jgi:hypothetical protein
MDLNKAVEKINTAKDKLQENELALFNAKKYLDQIKADNKEELDSLVGCWVYIKGYNDLGLRYGEKYFVYKRDDAFFYIGDVDRNYYATKHDSISVILYKVNDLFFLNAFEFIQRADDISGDIVKKLCNYADNESGLTQRNYRSTYTRLDFKPR